MLSTITHNQVVITSPTESSGSGQTNAAANTDFKRLSYLKICIPRPNHAR